MQIKGFLGLSVILLLVGCSTTTDLSPAGAQIKFVNTQPGSECRLVGQVVGEQNTWFAGTAGESGSMRGAANDLRNKAAAMGGNVIFGADSTEESFWSSFVPMNSKMVGQVYNCPK